ncbi:unnamed protein product [Urochloa humidicola]
MNLIKTSQAMMAANDQDGALRGMDVQHTWANVMATGTAAMQQTHGGGRDDDGRLRLGLRGLRGLGRRCWWQQRRHDSGRWRRCNVGWGGVRSDRTEEPSARIELMVRMDLTKRTKPIRTSGIWDANRMVLDASCDQWTARTVGPRRTTTQEGRKVIPISFFIVVGDIYAWRTHTTPCVHILLILACFSHNTLTYYRNSAFISSKGRALHPCVFTAYVGERGHD